MWKIVPGERTGVWERTLADLSATTRLNVLSGVGGSQTGPHLIDGDGTHHVGRIRRTLTGVDWVHHGAQFEVHSTVDGQPVELPQSCLSAWTSVRLWTSPYSILYIYYRHRNVFWLSTSLTPLAAHGFRHSAVAVWNSLPHGIQNSFNIYCFKRDAKTQFFTSAFVFFNSIKFIIVCYFTVRHKQLYMISHCIQHDHMKSHWDHIEIAWITMWLRHS